MKILPQHEKKSTIPRITKINSIDGWKVAVVFNNGETRAIDFKKSFGELMQHKLSPASRLSKPAVFAKVTLNNHTLSWEDVTQAIRLPAFHLMIGWHTF